MQSSKIFTIFAGVNGAGKSTLYQIDDKMDLGVRLNSDEIIKSRGEDWRSLPAQIAAGKEILRLQEYCFNNGLSCNRETTLAGNNILQSIKKAKALGYIIRLRYVGVSSVDIAKERIEKRIAMGGHGVSEYAVDRRFESSSENFIKIVGICDSVNIFDNSGQNMQLVAFKKNGKIERTEIECKWCDELIKKFSIV